MLASAAILSHRTRVPLSRAQGAPFHTVVAYTIQHHTSLAYDTELVHARGIDDDPDLFRNITWRVLVAGQATGAKCAARRVMRHPINQLFS